MRLLIILLLLPCFSIGQVYYPFPVSDAIWQIELSDQTCSEMNVPVGEYQYETDGDTTIGAYQYVKIKRSGVGTFPNECVPGFPANGYMGAYRQEIPAKKILFIPAGNINETLLIDFNWDVGDTMSGYLVDISYICEYPPVIYDIDSIYIGNSYRRRLWYTSGVWCWGQLIEGIGGTQGLLESLQSYYHYSKLECYRENLQPLYPDTNANCPPLTGINEPRVVNKVRIHPNPTKGIFTVQNTIGIIRMHDLYGRLVLETTNPQINLSTYAPGMYFVRAGTTTTKLILTK